MDEIDKLAEQAEAEIHEMKRQCQAAGHDAQSRTNLWKVIQAWVGHPRFDEGFNALEVVVLNELEFTLSDELLRSEGWRLIAELAGRWHREGNETRKEALRIASFEIAAEPPEYAPTLELLFSLTSDPDTRWAVFAAYENFPWRLRPHARKYSGGSITDDDCDEWLTSLGLYQDEILMILPRNDLQALKSFLETEANKRIEDNRCPALISNDPDKPQPLSSAEGTLPVSGVSCVAFDQKMKAALGIISAVILMHIIGCAVFFTKMMGPMAILASPLLSIFAWFMVPFELIGVSLQWILYNPKQRSPFRFLGFAALSMVVGGLGVMLYIPDFLGFVTGVSSATTSFLWIHLCKSASIDNEQELHAPQ